MLLETSDCPFIQLGAQVVSVQISERTHAHTHETTTMVKIYSDFSASETFVSFSHLIHQ